MLRGMPNDVYFTVGLIAIIGLSAKNAILIIQFAKDLRAQGKPLFEATVRRRIQLRRIRSRARVMGFGNRLLRVR
jgi:multidrug efflux pump